MKNANTHLQALLKSDTPFLMADLFEFLLLNQTAFYMTSFDQPIEDDYKVYLPAAIERNKIKTSMGIEVDTLELNIFARPKDQLNKLPIVAGALKGCLDGARITLKRAFMTGNRMIPVGTVHLFSGRVSDISCTQTQLKIAVKSDIELLNAKVPRNIYQAPCLNTLYDTTCKATPVWQTGIIENVSANYVVAQFDGVPDAQRFNNGVIEFKNGHNKGISRSIKKYSVPSDTGASPPVIALKYPLREFHFLQPFPHPIQWGDEFQVCAGCDKTQATCKARFNNLANFRGFPFIPEDETAR